MQATSTFNTCIHLPYNKEQIDIHVNEGQNLKDLVCHLVQTYAIPPYLTLAVYSTILSAMTNNNNGISDVSKAEMRHLFVESYQHTLQYNNKPVEVRKRGGSFICLSILILLKKDIFQKAYHTIIRSPVTGLFDAILDLEQSYAFAIQELHTKSDQQLISIQSR
jgi:hypothetical protein